jgi:hypothetical protein
MLFKGTSVEYGVVYQVWTDKYHVSKNGNKYREVTAII